MNAKEKVKKEPTLLLALTPVVLTVIILIFSVSVLKVDVQVPLILGTCITAFIAIVFLGYTWQDLEDGAIESLKSIMQAVLLLIIIGEMCIRDSSQRTGWCSLCLWGMSWRLKRRCL